MLQLNLCLLLSSACGIFTGFINDASGQLSTGNVGYPSYVTEYIEKGQIKEGQKNCSVNINGTIISYSGLITVVNTPDIKSYSYFWFIPAQINPKNAPVMIWLQGGPGATSFVGLFTEHGPFYTTPNKKLRRRELTWTKYISIIYVDNPVGVGYSYTTSDAGYANNEDDIGKNLVNFLVQFFILFPDLRENDFFVAGESYAGKYVPALGYAIDQHNSARNGLKINLKGISIGNGFCDPRNQISYGEFLYQIGLVDSSGKTEFQDAELRIVNQINNKDFMAAYREFDAMINGDLTEYPTLFYNQTGFKNYFNYLVAEANPTSVFSNGFVEYVQSDKVRRALHVGNLQFNAINFVAYKHLMNDIMQSVKPLIEHLLEKGYKVFIYNGHLDIIVAYSLTVNFLNALSWSGKDNYLNATRQKFIVNGELAGYYKEASNLIELVVRDAGHLVPTDQPLWAFELINRFIFNLTLSITN